MKNNREQRWSPAELEALELFSDMYADRSSYELTDVIHGTRDPVPPEYEEYRQRIAWRSDYSIFEQLCRWRKGWRPKRRVWQEEELRAMGRARLKCPRHGVRSLSRMIANCDGNYEIDGDEIDRLAPERAVLKHRTAGALITAYGGKKQEIDRLTREESGAE